MNNSGEIQRRLVERLGLFKYWAAREFDLQVSNEAKRIRCVAGSNASLQEAEQNCFCKAERVQAIVNGQVARENTYERPMREEIVKELDDDNVITRNYYGALILNTASLSVFDIDSYKKTLWETITFKKIDNKTAIVDMLRRLYGQRVLPGTSWRIYETTKGIRLIVLGSYIAPESKLFTEFSTMINSDSLYNFLCRQQKCYRARLTPKPYRMKIDSIKYRLPIPEERLQECRDWVCRYEKASRDFAVCRLLDTLGSTMVDNAIVDLHDHYCCNDNATRLA